MTGPNMYIDVGAVWNIEKISGQHRFPKAIILLTVSIPEITNPDLKKEIESSLYGSSMSYRWSFKQA